MSVTLPEGAGLFTVARGDGAISNGIVTRDNAGRQRQEGEQRAAGSEVTNRRYVEN